MFEYENLKICYSRYGNIKGKSIVLLHGWGQNKEMMDFIGAKLKDCDVITIDLPGFGKSDEPDSVWSVYDYVEMIHSLVLKLKVKNPVVIGHSFGGKLALLYASKYECSKLVSLASPYRIVVKKLSTKQKIMKKMAKVKCLEGLANYMKKYIGSTDYKNATPKMRDILVKHLNTDITEDVKKIKVPTLLIWGTEDKEVDLDIAYELNKYIKDSAVIEYPGCTHYAYLEDLNRTVRIIKSFLEGK